MTRDAFQLPATGQVHSRGPFAPFPPLNRLKITTVAWPSHKNCPTSSLPPSLLTVPPAGMAGTAAPRRRLLWLRRCARAALMYEGVLREKTVLDACAPVAGVTAPLRAHTATLCANSAPAELVARSNTPLLHLRGAVAPSASPGTSS